MISLTIDTSTTQIKYFSHNGTMPFTDNRLDIIHIYIFLIIFKNKFQLINFVWQICMDVKRKLTFPRQVNFDFMRLGFKFYTFSSHIVQE